MLQNDATNLHEWVKLALAIAYARCICMFDACKRTSIGGCLDSVQQRIILRVESHSEGRVHNVPIDVSTKVCNHLIKVGHKADNDDNCKSVEFASMYASVLVYQKTRLKEQCAKNAVLGITSCNEAELPTTCQSSA